jgi:transcriptional antiterminator Rof (Rho-off)
MKFDACINTDFFEMTCPHRCAVRLHMFHGVAGKYGIDCLTVDVSRIDIRKRPVRDEFLERVDEFLRT